MTEPITFYWDGEVMRPASPRNLAACDKEFVVGERYALMRYEERSTASHNHEFAWLAEAWRNLPEQYADMFPSPEVLRKRALIDAGFYNETVVDAGSNAAALRVASAFRARDEFAAVVVRGPIVVIRDAKSQSRRAMDRREFQASKEALMEVVASMLGVTVGDLMANAGMAP